MKWSKSSIVGEADCCCCCCDMLVTVYGDGGGDGDSDVVVDNDVSLDEEQASSLEGIVTTSRLTTRGETIVALRRTPLC